MPNLTIRCMLAFPNFLDCNFAQAHIDLLKMLLFSLSLYENVDCKWNKTHICSGSKTFKGMREKQRADPYFRFEFQ